MPILCVDVLIVRNRQVLLVNRKIEPLAGQWWTPGGRMLRGESIRESVKRIAKAETGLRVEPLGFVTHLEFQSKADPFGHGHGTHTVSLVYAAEYVGGKYKPDKTNGNSEWWDGDWTSAPAPTPAVMVRIVDRYFRGRDV